MAHDGYNLLVGALALRKGCIDKDQLATAWGEACRDRTLLLDLLCDRQWVSPQAAAEIEQFLRSELGDAADVLLSQVSDDGAPLRTAQLLEIAPAAATVSARPASTERRGRYLLISPFAQGALGQIWLATDPQLGRQVALKEILPHLCHDEAAIRRFVAEAKITGQLQHPHIVPVHELSSGSPTDPPFFAMQFIEGRTLEDAIAALHQWPPSSEQFQSGRLRLLRAFVDVCGAIGYAHSRGIAHRDLKPANIVLGDYGERFVLDWGLAKHFDVVDRDSIESATLITTQDLGETVAGQIVGTPAFMSPEQAAGKLGEIGSRSDIYGLGAILFAILTGESPHERIPQGTLSEFLKAICEGRIPKARAIARHVPRPLEAVCCRALATDPLARHESALALANDVQQWMDGEPVSAYREPRRQRLARWLLRHRTVTQAVAAALLTLIVAVTTLLAHSISSAMSMASFQLENFRNEGNQVQASVGSEVDNLIDQVRFIAQAPQLRQHIAPYVASKDKEALRQRLTEFCKQYLYFAGRDLSMQIALAEDHETFVRLYRKTIAGPLMEDLPDDVSIADPDYFKRFQPSGEPRLSAMMPSAEANSQYADDLVVVRAAAPIFENNQLVAVVSIDKEVGQLLNAILMPTSKPGIVAFVVNDKGELLFHASAEGPLRRESGVAGREIAAQELASSGRRWMEFFDDREGPKELLIPPLESSTGDAVYLGKLSYGPSPAEHFIGLVITAKHDSVVAQAIGKRNRIALIAALLMAASIAAAILGSQMLSRAAHRE